MLCYINNVVAFVLLLFGCFTGCVVYDLLVAYVMMAWFVLMIGLFYLIVSDYCVVVGMPT